MTLFLLVAVTQPAIMWLHWQVRAWYVPWYERRLQERAQGLPRGVLRERWHTPGHDDSTWPDRLRQWNDATRYLRGRLYPEMDREKLP